MRKKYPIPQPITHAGNEEKKVQFGGKDIKTKLEFGFKQIFVVNPLVST